MIRQRLAPRRGGHLAAAAAAVALLLATTACTGPSQPSAPEAADTPAAPQQTIEGPTSKPYTGTVPAFSGPYADDFTSTYRSSKSDFERSVLKDNKITDQEMSEARDKFKKCLTSRGFTNITFSASGAFSVDAPNGEANPQTEALVKACSESSGEAGIGSLYTTIRRNPENINENEIMAKCFTDAGLVDPGYTAKDYERDSSDENFLDSLGDRTAVEKCMNDPLGTAK